MVTASGAMTAEEVAGRERVHDLLDATVKPWMWKHLADELHRLVDGDVPEVDLCVDNNGGLYFAELPAWVRARHTKKPRARATP